MFYTVNPAGYIFVWPEGSPYIEIFHSESTYPEYPLEVIFAGDLKRSESDLKRLANETPEYGRPYV